MGKKKQRELSGLQRETLIAICDGIDLHGFSPSSKDLADQFGISAPSLTDRLKQLERKGYIRREPGATRCITVLRRPYGYNQQMKLTPVPILGSVSAGIPLVTEENSLGEVLVQTTLVSKGIYFALRTNGHSMTKAGIQDGDLLIVRQQPLGMHGDIVIASLNNEITVKRLRYSDTLIELVPEHPRMKPIVIGPEDDFRIIGVVVGSQST